MMKKRPILKQQLDPSFDNTLCSKCGNYSSFGYCLLDEERILINITECEDFMEIEDTGCLDEDLGIGQDEPGY